MCQTEDHPDHLIRRNNNTPRLLSDLHRLDGLSGLNINDGYVVGIAIGGDQVFLIGRERQLPDPLSGDDVIFNFVGFGIYHGHAIGGAKGHKHGLAIRSDLGTNRLQPFGQNAGYFKGDLAL